MIIITFFNSFLLFFCHAEFLVNNSLVPKIINGENAKTGEIPYQVSLQKISRNFHFCGGSILSKNYVITAAHCVTKKNASTIQVIAGTLKLSEPQSLHYVEKVIVHEFYNKTDSWRNDIALIKVKDFFIMSNVINTISLPKPNMVIKPRQKAIVSGWGRLQKNGLKPDDLQKADIIIADQKLCKKVYRKNGRSIMNSQICAYDPNIKKGSCKGDSGGPLTKKGVLIGIVSWSHGCAKTKYPSVYTRVSKFLKWIKTHAL